MATVPANDERPPLGEPGKRRSGASTGGMAESATQGVEESLQRSTERGLDDPMGASTGNASGGAAAPRIDLGGTNEPGAGPGTGTPVRGVARSGADDRADAPSDRVRPPSTGTGPHHPKEPRDESAVESLGRAVGEVVTGSDEEATDPRRPRR